MKSVKRNSTLIPIGTDAHEPIKKPKLGSSNIKLPNPVPSHVKTTPQKNYTKYHKEINDDQMTPTKEIKSLRKSIIFPKTNQKELEYDKQNKVDKTKEERKRLSLSDDELKDTLKLM